MGTGLIVAFVVAIWAAYFVPLVLRRYDEASTTSSLETLSPLSRSINRPTSEQDAEAEPEPPTVDAPVDTSVAGTVDEPVDEAGPEPAPRPRASGAAARLAARRRRRTLLTLLFLTAVVGGVSAFRVIPVWSVAVPVGLVVAWLIACRVQVRHERGIAGPRRPSFLTRSTEKAGGEQVTPTAHEEEETVIVSGQFEDVDPGRKHVMESTPLEAHALDDQLVIAAPSVATSGDLVWDPLPITVPTYVTKPRAGRTVRTIDFAQPGAWTSGHVEGEDVELPGRERAAEPASGEAQRRAANE